MADPDQFESQYQQALERNKDLCTVHYQIEAQWFALRVPDGRWGYYSDTEGGRRNRHIYIATVNKIEQATLFGSRENASLALGVARRQNRTPEAHLDWHVVPIILRKSVTQGVLNGD